MEARDQMDTHVVTVNPDIPAGWSYNPSTWRERGPLLALAGVGLLISAVLAAYQFGLLPEPWDPIFGPASSARVLHSPVSRLLPVPDASLGVLGYAAEIALGAIGGQARWRTLPGAALFFGLVVLALGVASTLLLVLQGAVVHSWCTLCLASAAISIFVLSMAPGEALAALQQVNRWLAAGEEIWPALLGQAPGVHDGGRGELRVNGAEPLWSEICSRHSIESRISQWAQIAAILLGIWLLVAPDALGYGDPARTVERAIGPVVIAVAALAVRSATRPVRYVNVVTGLALLLAPWVFAYTGVPAVATSGLAGMAVLGLALVGGRASNQRARDRQSLSMKATETSLAQGS